MKVWANSATAEPVDATASPRIPHEKPKSADEVNPSPPTSSSSGTRVVAQHGDPSWTVSCSQDSKHRSTVGTCETLYRYGIGAIHRYGGLYVERRGVLSGWRRGVHAEYMQREEWRGRAYADIAISGL